MKLSGGVKNVNQIKSSSWMKTMSWFYICGWMIKQRRQILEPNKMTVQNGMKRITEWMKWMDGMDGWDGWMGWMGWMDGRTDGWMDLKCKLFVG